jgi:hypothetical protein
MFAEKKIRPFSVTILALFVFCLALWNGLRLGDALYFWKTLAVYNANPLYLSISGGVWLILGLFLAWNLWSGKIIGPVAGLLGALGYTAWYWFDRLFLQEPHSNWSFALIANFVLLLMILLILFSPRSKRFFGRDFYERYPPDPTST